MPFRVSIAAGWPMVTSLAWVSGMRSTALSRPGSTIRASVAPLWAHCPTSSGSSCRMPFAPAITTMERTRLALELVDVPEPVDLGLLQANWESDASVMTCRRSCSTL